MKVLFVFLAVAAVALAAPGNYGGKWNKYFRFVLSEIISAIKCQFNKNLQYSLVKLY